MPDSTDRKQYVLLPRRGLRAEAGDPSAAVLAALPRVVSTGPSAAAVLSRSDAHFEIIDSASETGPKLVSMNEGAANRVREAEPGLRLMEVVFYEPAIVRPAVMAAPAATTRQIVFKVVDRATGAPVPGAKVIAFEDFDQKWGGAGISDPNGNAIVQLSSAAVVIDRLYVYPPLGGYWGAFRSNLPLNASIRIDLDPVRTDFVDCLRHFYSASQFDPATGVRVGVVDTGVDPHPDLNLLGGRNTVTGQPAADFHDNGAGHGTHVAGIIGASGGLRGVAPGAEILSYRVFPAPGQSGTNYAIVKAMILAQADGCDVLNMSLGISRTDPTKRDPLLDEAVADARDGGTLVVVAAGNDSRGPISMPASTRDAIAVTASGRLGTFPAGSVEEGDIDQPAGSDASDFLATFSNIGFEADLTAPGVGVLSTLPGNQYGPMSGTSMACPAAAGAAACLLSRNPLVYGLPRDRTRSDAFERLVTTSAAPLGFGGIQFEGHGMPRC